MMSGDVPEFLETPTVRSKTESEIVAESFERLLGRKCNDAVSLGQAIATVSGIRGWEAQIFLSEYLGMLKKPSHDYSTDFPAVSLWVDTLPATRWAASGTGPQLPHAPPRAYILPKRSAEWDEAEQLFALNWNDPAAKQEYGDVSVSELGIAIAIVKGKAPFSELNNVGPLANKLVFRYLSLHPEVLRLGEYAALPATRQRPGPVPDTDEEMARRVIDFISTGWTQEVYYGRKYVSKYQLQKAIAWARNNQDYFQVISGVDNAMMKTIKERLRWR